VGVVVEGDAQADLDVPVADPDLLDHQAQQLLALLEVEAVEGGEDPLGEGADPVAQPVVGGEGVALVGERLALLDDDAAASVEFLDAALQFDQVDQPGLVAVDQATAFGLGGLGLAV
jgi:hypothetical protein